MQYDFYTSLIECCLHPQHHILSYFTSPFRTLMYAKQQQYVLPNCTISPPVCTCPLISPPHWFSTSCYLLQDTGAISFDSFFSFATTPPPHPPSHITFCRLGFSLLFLFWHLRPRPLPCIPYCLPLPLSLSICHSLSSCFVLPFLAEFPSIIHYSPSIILLSCFSRTVYF